MAKYKVIYRAKNCAWNEGCPIQVSAVQVSRDTTTGACYLQTRLRNISGSRCSSIEFVVDLADAAGDAERIEFKLLDADLPAGGTMAPQAKKMSLSEVAHAEATVTRVDDAHGFGTRVAISDTEPFGPGRDLLAERTSLLAEAGAKADLCAGKHHEHGNWWQCGCGAINLDRGSCWKCQAPLELLRNADSAEYLSERIQQKSYDAAIAKLESKNPSQVAAGVEALKSLAERGFKDSGSRLAVGKERLSALNAARMRGARRAKTAAAILAAVVIAGFAINSFVIVPARSERIYSQAVTAESNQKYNDAIELYKSLGDYKDSAEKVNELNQYVPDESVYLIAERKEADGYYEKAIELFESLGDYKDSADRANGSREMLYQEALSQLNEGDYYAAIDLFSGLGDYADAPQRIEEARALAGK